MNLKRMEYHFIILLINIGFSLIAIIKDTAIPKIIIDIGNSGTTKVLVAL